VNKFVNAMFRLVTVYKILFWSNKREKQEETDWSIRIDYISWKHSVRRGILHKRLVYKCFWKIHLYELKEARLSRGKVLSTLLLWVIHLHMELCCWNDSAELFQIDMNDRAFVFFQQLVTEHEPSCREDTTRGKAVCWYRWQSSRRDIAVSLQHSIFSTVGWQLP
jgi:hypothetical protein